jgi:hypothetical protein
MLLSVGIPDDPILPIAVFRRLPLSVGPQEWAKAAMQLLRDPEPSREGALTALKHSPMDMDHALDALLELHI